MICISLLVVVLKRDSRVIYEGKGANSPFHFLVPTCWMSLFSLLLKSKFTYYYDIRFKP